MLHWLGEWTARNAIACMLASFRAYDAIRNVPHGERLVSLHSGRYGSESGTVNWEFPDARRQYAEKRNEGVVRRAAAQCVHAAAYRRFWGVRRTRLRGFRNCGDRLATSTGCCSECRR